MAYVSRVVESSKYYQCYERTFEVINIINEIGVAGWEAWWPVGKKTVFESGSPCLDALVMPTRWQQCEQSVAWVALVLNDFLCFPKVSYVVDALHGLEMAADDAVRLPILTTWGLPILTTCGLPIRKSRIQLQREEFNPRLLSLRTCLTGTIVLNAEL